MRNTLPQRASNDLFDRAVTPGLAQRSRFTTALPTSMTAAQFVDTLNANAGNPLSPAALSIDMADSLLNIDSMRI
jgi:hypothetical protein